MCNVGWRVMLQKLTRRSLARRRRKSAVMKVRERERDNMTREVQLFLSKTTGPRNNTCAWLRECCRQVEAEVTSNSRNKLHQTTYKYYFRAQYCSLEAILQKYHTKARSSHLDHYITMGYGHININAVRQKNYAFKMCGLLALCCYAALLLTPFPHGREGDPFIIRPAMQECHINIQQNSFQLCFWFSYKGGIFLS